MIEIVFMQNLNEKTVYKQFIFRIISECSNEFFPPIIGRYNTTQKELSELLSSNDSNKYLYFQSLYEQLNIFTVVDGNIAGFMSFIHNYRDKVFDSYNIGTNNYISTLCVDLKYRHQGLANLLYSYIENDLPIEIRSSFTSTRTWSSNSSHLSLLNKRNYVLVKRVINDREYHGKVADTVYLAKSNSDRFHLK